MRKCKGLEVSLCFPSVLTNPSLKLLGPASATVGRKCKMMQLLWKTEWKNKKIEWLYELQNHIWVYTWKKKNEIRIWMRYLQSHIHCNTVHNIQEVETTYSSMSGWMDKENVVYTPNGTLFSIKKGKCSHLW